MGIVPLLCLQQNLRSYVEKAVYRPKIITEQTVGLRFTNCMPDTLSTMLVLTLG